MNAEQSVTATFHDNTPPTVTHGPVTSQPYCTPIPLTATISDNVVVHSAALFYRVTGAPGYTALALTPAGATYSSTIPANIVTHAGLEYYLEARDAAANVRRSPTTAPEMPYTVGVPGVIFTDEPLVPAGTAIKATPFAELADAVNTVRACHSLSAFTWSAGTPAPGALVRAGHLTDLRGALAGAYTSAGRPAPTYTDGTVAAGTTPIKASHLTELRTLVRDLE